MEENKETKAIEQTYCPVHGLIGETEEYPGYSMKDYQHLLIFSIGDDPDFNDKFCLRCLMVLLREKLPKLRVEKKHAKA